MGLALYLDGARAVALGSAILADVEQRPARLSRRNRRMGKLAIVAIVAATLGLAAVPFTNHAERATPVVLAYGAFMSWLVLTACWFGWYRASVEESVVEVREHEGAPRLHAGGVPLRAYRKGAAARLPDGTARVELRAGLDALRVHLPSLEQARALLGALGLDRRVGSSTFRVRTFVQTRFLTLFSVVTGCFAYVSLVVGLTPAVLVSLALPLVIWTALALRSVRSLTVGADGLELRGLMHRSFVPHASIRRVCRVDSRGRPLEESDRSVSPGFSVELTSGRRLLVDSRIERFEANAWQGDAIHDAVFLAWSRARDQPAAAAAFLARGGRTTREWLAALRAGTQSAGYRTATPDARALEAVLVDATASRELRLGAAVALAASDPPRLRVAADEVADDAVRRVALAVDRTTEAAQEDDLAAEIERAMRAGA